MRAYRSPVPAAPARPRLAPARTGRRSAEPDAPPPARTSAAVLLREIVAHLRQCRVQLRDEMGAAHHRGADPHGDEPGGDLRGSDVHI